MNNDSINRKKKLHVAELAEFFFLNGREFAKR